jgi:hypothetical protein
MIVNGFEEKIFLKYSEIDQNLAMKPFALLNFLQDIASENVAEGEGHSCRKNDVCIAITAASVFFFSVPRFRTDGFGVMAECQRQFSTTDATSGHVTVSTIGFFDVHILHFFVSHIFQIDILFHN